MNPRLTFLVFVSLYVSVLVASYSLAAIYPFFTPYGWLLLPVLANFCLGFFLGDVVAVVKTIIVGFSLQAGIVLGLLYSSSLSEAFVSVTVISSYYTLQVPLGITVSLVGTAVKKDSADIIAVCTHLAQKMKRIAGEAVGKVGRTSFKVYSIYRRQEAALERSKAKNEIENVAKEKGVSSVFMEAVSSMDIEDIRTNLQILQNDVKKLDTLRSRNQISNEVYYRQRQNIENKTKLLNELLYRRYIW